MNAHTKQQAILGAIRDNGKRWPSEFSKGIMVYQGHRIIFDEYVEVAKRVSEPWKMNP